ncbi:hypothetical protein [Caldivirga sp. MU80]|uniref:hypothetical protein n=1 Tax=Caldivirga sp. MU80 TaxID=1650354 RepID=UPI000AA95BA8|nr:hypothetical protein [Caldivirga sp. MU80]
MNIFFLMNGNIFNYSLASEQYSWKCNCGLLGCSTCSAYATPPASPASIPTPPASVLCVITGECKPIFAQSYINAYSTAFNQPVNRQYALNKYYQPFDSNEVNSNFVPGTFGYEEEYSSYSQSLAINYLQDDASVYVGTPYLFVSAGSGGGSGFMYLDWVIVTYGVPYVMSIS